MNIKELSMKGELQYNTVGIKHIPFKLFGTAKIIKKADGDRIIAGYANLAVIDSQNQLISVEVLKAGMETLLADPAYANLMFTHKNIQIGKIINKYGNLETHVDDKGVYIIAEIRKDIETANQVWKQILKGELNGFSIGCEVLDEHKSCDVDGENCIDILDKINIFEISACNYPVNEMSGFVVISKSKFKTDVCKDCDINNDTMKKKIESEVKEEIVKEEKAVDSVTKEENITESEETAELSVEQRIESMERQIFNIEAAITKMAESKQKKEEEEEEPEEPEEEKKKSEPEGQVKENVDESDDLKKSINEVAEQLGEAVEKLSSLFSEEKDRQEIDDLKLESKSKDDQIDALKKKVEILSKEDIEKTEPKTVNKSEEESEVEVELMEDCNINIKDGIVSRKRYVY